MELEKSGREKSEFSNLVAKSESEELIIKELMDEELREKTFLQREEESIVNYGNGSNYRCSLKSVIKYPKVLNTITECFAVRFEKLENLLAAGYANGYVIIYNIETGDFQRFFTNTEFPIMSLRWKPHVESKNKSILVAVSSEGRITHWHTSTGKVLHQMEEKNNPIMCMDYSSDGSLFVTAGNDRQVRLYDDNMKSVVTIMKPGGMYNPGHSNRIFSVCFHRGFLGMLASGGWDNTVQFYDVRSGTITNSIYGPHICGDALDFKDYMLLTGSWSTSNQVQLWDIRNYKLIKTVDWDKEKTPEATYCYSAQFNKDKNSSLFSVGCSNMNMVRTFDNANEDLPMMNSKLYKACYTVDYSFNGKYFAFGSGDGNIRVLNIEKIGNN